MYPAEPTSDFKARFPLLTEQDWLRLQNRGLGYPAQSHLVHVHSETSITFTVHGIQFYKAAMEHYGVAASLASVKTDGHLYDLACKVIDIRRIEADRNLRVAYENGTLDPAQRKAARAYLNGSLGEMFAAAKEWLQLRTVGRNIIPLDPKEKRR